MSDLLNDLQSQLPTGYTLQQVSDIGMYKIKKQLSQTKDAELKKEFKKLLSIKEELEVYKKFSVKYKKVLFFEKKKCKKLFDRAMKTEDKEAITKAKVDYIYTLQFPMNKKYISVLSEAKDATKKMEIYNEISERVNEGKIDTTIPFKPFKTPARVLKNKVKGISKDVEMTEAPEADEFFQ